MKIKKEILDKLKDYCDRNNLDAEFIANNLLESWADKNINAEKEYEEFMEKGGYDAWMKELGGCHKTWV